MTAKENGWLAKAEISNAFLLKQIRRMRCITAAFHHHIPTASLEKTQDERPLACPIRAAQQRSENTRLTGKDVYDVCNNVQYLGIDLRGEMQRGEKTNYKLQF
jgi:hypothetical protein